MKSAPSYRDLVREIAYDNYGYVTTKLAVQAGVPAVELPKLASRGGLVNVAYGLYRVPDIPPTPYDEFAEAVLRIGEGSALYAESVLSLFGLADVNPRIIKVAVQRRARPTLPPSVELVHVRESLNTTSYLGIEAQPISDAILACRGRVITERLIDAVEQAHGEGLVTSSEREQLMDELLS